jgi:hypothetical protein
MGEELDFELFRPGAIGTIEYISIIFCRSGRSLHDRQK